MNEAVELLELIPRDHKGSLGTKFDYDTTRERILCTSGKGATIASMSKLSQVVYSTHTASASLSVLAGVRMCMRIRHTG